MTLPVTPNTNQRRFFVTYYSSGDEGGKPCFLLNDRSTVRLFFTREEAEAVAVNLFQYLKADYRLVFVNECLAAYQAMGVNAPPEKWSGVA